AFPYVIGAMASNYDQHRACFSNRGDVAAPGGDGDRPVSDRGDVTCQPPWEACDRQGQCDRYSLLGPVWPNGYEAWVGTSFSAPLVSGLAALVLEEGGGSLSSEDVSIAIMTPAAVPPGSDLPTGIISVTGSLQP
ncbi:MAG TPA: S8 family serine peptidase, partial [Anaerolineae bacterium]|nr:S8 family serine peptidase [Anaerolineae bacterium]